MVAGDGLALAAAQKAAKEQDRIRDNRAAQQPPRIHMVLTEQEKKAMGIQDDQAGDRSRERLLRILILLFGIVVVLVVLGQTATHLPDAENIDPASHSAP